eukprot:7243417-Ditylum_brightwellii.AAC.1
MNAANDCLHAVSIYKGFIFDSDLASAIELSKDSLDWCSQAENNDIEYSELTGFKRITELNPTAVTGEKEESMK